jgi:hypothetical protein
MSESIEFLGYLTSFWAFLFNRRYRAARIAEWREGNWAERVFMLYEALVSFGIGAALPVALWWSLQ